MMCKADFWIFLLRRLTNWDSTKNRMSFWNWEWIFLIILAVIDITYRKYFLEYAGNSWDSTHVVRNNVKNVKVSNTNVCGTTLKMAVRANATTKYHTIKCVNPVPSGEGQFWAVGIRVNLIDTDSKTGFGILPKQSDEVYRCNSTLVVYFLSFISLASLSFLEHFWWFFY